MRRTEHFLLLSWLLITGLVFVGTYVLIDQGLMGYLIATDRSYVSVIVMVMYLVGLGHSLVRTWAVSCELNWTGQAEQVLKSHAGAPIRLVDGSLACGDGILPRSFLSTYIIDLMHTRRAQQTELDSAETGADLLEGHSVRWRSENEFGWFLIDLMLKVGFLGTLVGFIWMLA